MCWEGHILLLSIRLKSGCIDHPDRNEMLYRVHYPLIPGLAIWDAYVRTLRYWWPCYPLSTHSCVGCSGLPSIPQCLETRFLGYRLPSPSCLATKKVLIVAHRIINHLWHDQQLQLLRFVWDCKVFLCTLGLSLTHSTPISASECCYLAASRTIL